MEQINETQTHTCTLGFRATIIGTTQKQCKQDCLKPKVRSNIVRKVVGLLHTQMGVLVQVVEKRQCQARLDQRSDTGFLHLHPVEVPLPETYNHRICKVGINIINNEYS